MQTLLVLVPSLPLIGALLLILSGGLMRERLAMWVGVGSVALAAVCAVIVAGSFFASGRVPLDVVLWHWMRIGPFAPRLALHLDALSLVMMLIVTCIGFLIHMFASAYMSGDDGFARFFAAMNLFIAAMLVLVLADDLLFLYAGWEGVGLCSYLLIGFWHKDPANGAAARKAFIVTRVGDTALIIALFLLLGRFGTLQIGPLASTVAAAYPAGDTLPTIACLLILLGATGKSAQFPLHTWLPDAMAGPTPVSALIHAATMVTAGVYLLARLHTLFVLAPVAQMAAGIVGAVTLLLAALAAFAQTDIKRVLAYSTISQIGYMFLALGVGADDAAIFHLMTHAFFKALLFLAAGAVILRLHHEQDMFRMGGLARTMPGVYACFLAGSMSLAALPLVTAGFYSKEAILGGAWAAGMPGRVLWLAGLVGAFVTALYTFRMVFIVFHGPPGAQPHGASGPRMMVPLWILAVLAILGGFIQMPPLLGGRPLLRDFLSPVLGAFAEPHQPTALAVLLLLVASCVPLAGAWLAWRRHLTGRDSAPQTDARSAFFRAGWRIDKFYEFLFVRPVLFVVRANSADAVDRLFDGLAWLTQAAHAALRRTQTGRVRWYAGWLTAGSVAALTLAVLT